MEPLEDAGRGCSVFLVPAACGILSENCWIPSLPLNTGIEEPVPSPARLLLTELPFYEVGD